jgi:hypothetical protein
MISTPFSKPSCTGSRGCWPGRSQRARAGFSQVEVAVSALLAGLVLTGALNLAGYATRGQLKNSDALRHRHLASGLMAEVLELPFEDPNQTPVFGPESGETSSPPRRSSFDDVDDYHNWSSPPQTKTGTAIENTAGLTTTVAVTLADPAALGAGASGTNSPEVKRVTVRLLRGSTTLFELIAVVTK